MKTKKLKKGIALFTIIFIIIILLVLGVVLFFTVKHFTIDNDVLSNAGAKEESTETLKDTPNSTVSNNETTATKYELMASQAEKKLSETFTTNHNEAFNNNYKYYATVDRDNIRYTNEFSEGEYYYVMIGTVRNSSTNLIVGKYLIRCKWDEKTNSIIEYGDNSKVILLLNVYEEVIYRVSGSIGVFYIDKEQYKKDILWDTSKINKNSFNEVLNNIDKLNYYYYEQVSTKNQTYFDEMKSEQIEIIKKLLKTREIKVYIVQIVTNNELASAVSLTEYLNSELYVANDENMKNLIDYSKKLGLYYEDTLFLSN